MSWLIAHHDLKIQPEFFKAVVEGTKTFEIRRNDRNFLIGDVLVLKEYDGNYTGKSQEVKITYMTDYAQQDGYVVLGIVPVEEEAE